MRQLLYSDDSVFCKSALTLSCLCTVNPASGLDRDGNVDNFRNTLELSANEVRDNKQVTYRRYMCVYINCISARKKSCVVLYDDVQCCVILQCVRWDCTTLWCTVVLCNVV